MMVSEFWLNVLWRVLGLGMKPETPSDLSSVSLGDGKGSCWTLRDCWTLRGLLLDWLLDCLVDFAGLAGGLAAGL